MKENSPLTWKAQIMPRSKRTTKRSTRASRKEREPTIDTNQQDIPVRFGGLAVKTLGHVHFTYSWPLGKSTIWSVHMKRELPAHALTGEYNTLYTRATPANVDLKFLGDIQLTTLELLFFPIHCMDRNIQRKLMSRGISAEIQAKIINNSRFLLPPYSIHPATITIIQQEAKMNDEDKDQEQIVEEEYAEYDKLPIDYYLASCCVGILDYLKSVEGDRGLFTAALEHAMNHHNFEVKLSDTQAYIREHSIRE
ncbi:hypothetical protein EJ04DRAFT_578010 [Polyplosphaeria fusca]|uniref:Uncharacterized protein n=1 Tax=Polyplosphaeria fusca TaxID=682080 RepID=A0A9P4QWT5_9PLEO|nr:hypothetical protein EJ04DRAFT_578010 [Polyplosphaeria fusca]